MIARGAFDTRAALRTDPFIWAVIEDFFDDSVAISLSSEFPADGFTLAGSQNAKFYVRSLAINGTLSSAADLSPAWRNVGLLISSSDYRRRLGDFLGRDLSRLRIDASLCRYTQGCALPPHTDRAERDTTQVIYFNREWCSEWGGLLQVLRSERPDDVASEVIPTLNTSVMMIRSERSWHAVSPVPAGVNRERLSLVINLSNCT